MFKRICSALLAAVMACSMSVTGFAENEAALNNDSNELVSYGEYDGDNGEYSYHVYDDGTVYIYSYKGSDENVVIPSKIDGNKVTQLGNHMFEGCSEIISISIPETVTEIGSTAFDCDKLEKITVSSKNKYFCSSGGILYNKDKTEIVKCPQTKTKVTIPDTVTTISNYAFAGGEITSVKIPNSVTSIGQGAFQGCEKLKSVTIPKSVKEIGVCAFGYTWSNGGKATGLTIKCYSGSEAEKYAKKATVDYQVYIKINYLVIDKTPSTPTVKKSSKSKNSVRLYFNKIGGISGYKVQKYDTAKKKWVTVGLSKTNYANGTGYNYKITGLKKGTKYKFRVQAYTKASSSKTLKSSWSKTFTVTTKK